MCVCVCVCACVIVCQVDWKTFTKKLGSYWVTHSFGFALHLSKMLGK